MIHVKLPARKCCCCGGDPLIVFNGNGTFGAECSKCHVPCTAATWNIDGAIREWNLMMLMAKNGWSLYDLPDDTDLVKSHYHLDLSRRDRDVATSENEPKHKFNEYDDCFMW